MLQLLKMVITSPAGSFGFTFALVVLVGWFVFWLHGKFVTMLAEHEHVKDDCERLDKRLEALRGDIHEIRGDIAYIKNMVNVQINTPVQGQSALLQSHSPLSLTEAGMDVASGMKAEEAIAGKWDSIRARLDRDVPGRTPYDIQTFCLEKIPVAPQEFFDAETVDAFKRYAFAHGRTLFECMKVVGILVRDKYFAALGISPSVLDETGTTTA